MKKLFTAAGAVICAVALIAPAAAIPITFVGSGTGPGDVPVAAEVTFDITGDTLTVTLTNTSGSNDGQDVPGSTLTGVFFDLTGDPTLTPVSATIPSGSSIIQGNFCDLTGPQNGDNAANCTAAQTNVGGEFGYQATNLTGMADRGIASSGYLDTGLAGDIGNFNNGAAGTNLDKPDSLNGINFGIVSAAAGFNPNGGLAATPLIRDTVTFLLTGVNGLTIEDILHVSFQYGTGLNELNVPGVPQTPDVPVPEPATPALVGVALLAIVMLGRRRRR